ncbi:hypothetical protein [Cumulibacter soli]|uniref:hypothetical protein n=1 Tax=Cumulibacter soli TaxID=2546344 RepID=UPI001067FA8F|nr:hypothetical protein [Cumulibacter soli]
MAFTLVVLTVVIGLPGIVLGALTVRVWNEIYDPDYFRDTVQQGAVAFLKLGLLLLLITLAVIAVAAGIIAHRDGSSPQFGVWFCAVASWLMSVGFIRVWLRLRRAKSAKAADRSP